MNALQQSLLFVIILASTILVGWLVYYLAPVLAPFLIAATLAYLTDPLVEKMTHKLGKFKLTRTLAVLLVFFIVILVMLVILLGLIPALQNQIILFVSFLPKVIDWLNNTLQPKLIALGVMPESIDFQSVKVFFTEHLTQVGSVAKWLSQAIFQSGLAFFGVIMNILIVFVATFYLLRDWPNILKAGRSLIPPSYSKSTVGIFKKCDEVLSTFVRGQLTVMLALGIFYGVGLAILGVNFSILLGFVAGLLSIVPYLGTFVGFGASLIVAYIQFGDWAHLLGVLAVFGVGNLIEGLVLTPLLIGDKLGLHPVVVIFAILAGGHLLGFVGILIALPLTAVLVVLAREGLHRLNHPTESKHKTSRTKGELRG
jgi:predicted PurR-regulated permease PerM